jgi:hypothetical protein
MIHMAGSSEDFLGGSADLAQISWGCYICFKNDSSKNI